MMRLALYLFAFLFAALPPAKAEQVKVGAIAGPSRYLQPMESARDLVKWIEKADADGVRILGTPEAYIGGYPLWNYVEQTIDIADGEKHKAEFIDAAIALDGKELALIRDAARKHDVAVIVGANLRGTEGNRYQVYNAVIFISEKGEIAGVHRKTSGSHTEREYWAFGDAASIKPVPLQGIEVMAVQCWEARNPLTVSQIALAAPDLLFLPTADYFQPEAGGEYLVEMRYIGRNAHSYVMGSTIMFDWKELERTHPDLAAAWRKKLPDAPMLAPGGAAAVDPSGKVIEVTKPFETRLLTATVDTDKVEGSMALHSVTDHYRLKGDYTLYVDGKKITGNGPDSIY
jgi:predicted amidohydrolase